MKTGKKLQYLDNIFIAGILPWTEFDIIATMHQALCPFSPA